MIKESNTGYILRITRMVLEECAPEELKSFPLLAEIYRDDPESFSSNADSLENLGLGFSGPEELRLIGAVVLGIVSSGVLEGTKNAVADVTKNALLNMIDKIKNRSQKSEKSPATHFPEPGKKLSEGERKHMVAFYQEILEKKGLKSPRSHKIAAAIVEKFENFPPNGKEA